MVFLDCDSFKGLCRFPLEWIVPSEWEDHDIVESWTVDSGRDGRRPLRWKRRSWAGALGAFPKFPLPCHADMGSTPLSLSGSVLPSESTFHVHVVLMWRELPPYVIRDPDWSQRGGPLDSQSLHLHASAAIGPPICMFCCVLLQSDCLLTFRFFSSPSLLSSNTPGLSPRSHMPGASGALVDDRLLAGILDPESRRGEGLPITSSQVPLTHFCDSSLRHASTHACTRTSTTPARANGVEEEEEDYDQKNKSLALHYPQATAPPAPLRSVPRYSSPLAGIWQTCSGGDHARIW